MNNRRHELSEAEYKKIEKYFPERKPGQRGHPAKSSRLVLNGILWILGTGASWRDLPDRYGSWKTVYSRFRKWQKEGIFEKIRAEFALEADMENLMIDSTSAKVHQSSNGEVKKGLPKQLDSAEES